jgi:hypothetical protein
MIGRLARQVMEMTPQEERRAYMFQPRMMLNMQTFMEEVLETEGITKEMIARQKKQSELLQTLLRADRDVQDHLLQERAGEIDETFFAMLNQFVEQAKQMNDDTQLLPMLNLRARLMTGTAVGRRLEAQQIAVHKMSQAAKKAKASPRKCCSTMSSPTRKPTISWMLWFPRGRVRCAMNFSAD